MSSGEGNINPPPVFLPGNPVDRRAWGHKESDMKEHQQCVQDRTLPPGPQASVTLKSGGSCDCCGLSQANPQGPSAPSHKEVLIRIFLRNAMTILKCMIQTLVSPVIPRVLHQKIRVL